MAVLMCATATCLPYVGDWWLTVSSEMYYSLIRLLRILRLTTSTSVLEWASSADRFESCLDVSCYAGSDGVWGSAYEYFLFVPNIFYKGSLKEYLTSFEVSEETNLSPDVSIIYSEGLSELICSPALNKFLVQLSLVIVFFSAKLIFS